ncbi:VOC family protein [Actinomadura rayongensis]|uniref:VOC family protein n=1 Tax=Actinomadura rayongensis TaxID=1429076 RepID=A0A6I4W8D9_9ACTN|nr:VOC family protein [Actinomadura rayongensis]
MLSLIVLYTARAAECVAFYAALGLDFVPERHGTGPPHHAAVLPDGLVFEIYPASDGRGTGALRLGFTARAAGLAPGRHLLRDPDGRTVDVRVPDVGEG